MNYIKYDCKNLYKAKGMLHCAAYPHFCEEMCIDCDYYWKDVDIGDCDVQFKGDVR